MIYIQVHNGHAKARPYFYTNAKLSPDDNNCYSCCNKLLQLFAQKTSHGN